MYFVANSLRNQYCYTKCPRLSSFTITVHEFGIWSGTMLTNKNTVWEKRLSFLHFVDFREDDKKVRPRKHIVWEMKNIDNFEDKE